MHWSIYKDTEEPVENICYDATHIAKVLSAIDENFPMYFENFINKKPVRNFVKVINKAIDEFESDRNIYKEIFDLETLEEYEDDPNAFKSEKLRNKCPVIRKTLNSKLEELKKYKKDFNRADPNELLEKITSICTFGKDYYEHYDSVTYEGAKNYLDLELYPLDEEECSLSGVIGVGIKSRILYKLYPAIFPNESQNSIWTLYFLSGREDFGCKYDSEFLMIDDEEIVTKQNFAYPYRLFAYYAFEIYKLLEREAAKINLPLEKNYRYVAVDAFLSSVAEYHDEDIKLYARQIANGGFGYGWS
ncbi:MAG: hypothetical protein IKT98_05260 [Selenomonadaceae bacterium]|nr:hypothetical protein [Selenomonadaceae bacterium]